MAIINTDKKTLEQGMNDYVQHVTPENASKAQLDDMEQAFMAGASFCVVLMHEIFTSEDNEQNKVKFLNIIDEIGAYAEKMSGGNE